MAVPRYDVVWPRAPVARRSACSVDYPTFGNIHGHDEDQGLERLPEVLQASEVDSVILGVGARGQAARTPAVVRAAVIAERAE